MSKSIRKKWYNLQLFVLEKKYNLHNYVVKHIGLQPMCFTTLVNIQIKFKIPIGKVDLLIYMLMDKSRFNIC